jgi:thiol-disulfide isomerase/thioredoxin
MVAVLSGCALLPPSPVSADQKASIPRLELRDLNGLRHSLREFRGELVVLNFWATWCGPCVEELPILQRVATDYANRGVHFIAVSVDDESTEGEIPRVLSRAGVRLPVWTGASTADMQRFGLGTAVPATVILDQKGAVTARRMGTVTEPQLRKELDDALKGSPPAPRNDTVISADAGCTKPCCAKVETAPQPLSVVPEPHHDHEKDEDHRHSDQHNDEHRPSSPEEASLVPS